MHYNLHYIEFMNSEMEFLAGGADAEYTGRNLTANTYVNPMAGAAALFSDGNRLAWNPDQFNSGAHDLYMTYKIPDEDMFEEEHFASVAASWNIWGSTYSAFNTAKARFNRQKAIYESALTARDVDGEFDTYVPPKPCPPIRPGEFTGFEMDATITTKAELEAAIASTGNPYIGFWNNTLTQQAGLSMKDDGAYAADIDCDEGACTFGTHIFGDLGITEEAPWVYEDGERVENFSLDDKAWSKYDPTGESHTMIVSVFFDEVGDAETVIETESEVAIKVSATTWGKTGYDYILGEPPVRPEPAVGSSMEAAKHLLISAAALGLVVSSAI